jgi:hypothetical protein
MNRLPIICDSYSRPSQYAKQDRKSLASRSNRAISGYIRSICNNGGDISTSIFAKKKKSRK